MIRQVLLDPSLKFIHFSPLVSFHSEKILKTIVPPKTPKLNHHLHFFLNFLSIPQQSAMSSILTPQGMVLATAMAVSGTVILLAFRLQKNTLNQLSLLVNAIPPTQSPEALPRSCISASAASPRSSSCSDGKKKKDKKKKRVHFAADVVDPTGNSDEYRKNFHSNRGANTSNSSSSSSNHSGKAKGMPANRIALYNGMLRDRVLHRTTYSY